METENQLPVRLRTKELARINHDEAEGDTDDDGDGGGYFEKGSQEINRLTIRFSHGFGLVRELRMLYGQGVE